MDSAEAEKTICAQGWRTALTSPAAKFAAWCGALFSLSVLLPRDFFAPLNVATARLAGVILRFFGEPALVEVTTVSLGAFRAEVATECSGIELWFLFLSFLAAHPASRKEKLIGGVAGAGLLYAGNLGRIALVTAVGAWQPRLFEFAHVYLAQVVMVILVCACCVAWRHWCAAGTGGAVITFLVRFLASATVLFALWLPVHRSYVAVLDQLVIYLFSLADFVLFIPPLPAIYHHTLSLVLFVALLLASGGISPRRKALWAALGIPLLVGAHLSLRITQVLLTAWHVQSVLPVHLALYLVNQYLLPVLLWVVILKREGRSEVRG